MFFYIYIYVTKHYVYADFLCFFFCFSGFFSSMYFIYFYLLFMWFVLFYVEVYVYLYFIYIDLGSITSLDIYNGVSGIYIQGIHVLLYFMQIKTKRKWNFLIQKFKYFVFLQVWYLFFSFFFVVIVLVDNVCIRLCLLLFLIEKKKKEFK